MLTLLRTYSAGTAPDTPEGWTADASGSVAPPAPFGAEHDIVFHRQLFGFSAHCCICYNREDDEESKN